MPDKFTFRCPFCESEIRVPVSAEGKSGTCKKCRNKVIVPKQKPATAAVAMPEKRSAAIPIGTTLLFLGGFSWGICATDEVFPWDYASIPVAGVGAFLLLTQYMPRRTARITAVLATLFGLYWYGANDSVSERWSNEATSYHDRYFRFNRVLHHRTMTFSDGDGKETSRSSGGMSESGKPHGRWDTTLYPSYDSATSFYWYGDQISEGEWHTRNGR